MFANNSVDRVLPSDFDKSKRRYIPLRAIGCCASWSVIITIIVEGVDETGSKWIEWAGRVSIVERPAMSIERVAEKGGKTKISS